MPTETSDRSSGRAGGSWHTPGPWVIDGYNGSSVIRCVTPKGHPDARHTCGDYEAVATSRGRDWRANALLIAAAPDMLSALLAAERELSAAEHGSVGGVPNSIALLIPEALAEVRAAIAKATGK